MTATLRSFPTSIGFNNRTFVDRFGTPHTENLHVVERWRIVHQGLSLRVDVEVQDPGTFYQPWKTYQVYRRLDRGFEPENLRREQLESVRLPHTTGRHA